MPSIPRPFPGHLIQVGSVDDLGTLATQVGIAMSSITMRATLGRDASAAGPKLVNEKNVRMIAGIRRSFF